MHTRSPLFTPSDFSTYTGTATGVHPSRHGVVSNNWRQQEGLDWSNMYAVGDPDHPILGFENEPVLEGRSPKNNLRAGLADWVLAADPDARTVVISKKDRAKDELDRWHCSTRPHYQCSSSCRRTTS